VDSVLDLLALDEGTALVVTGNPGRIYRVDLATLARAGLSASASLTPQPLPPRGFRRGVKSETATSTVCARRADGVILAGSAPKGNLYAFAADGGSPALVVGEP
jgi:hypothetical protein